MTANGPLAALLPAPFFARPDIVRRFLAWAQCADEEERAEAASALARAYLHSDLTPSMRNEAALAMTSQLDDRSALVRRALAEALSSASEAPRHVILALAADQSDVAAAVLQRSPVLTDADLVDCAAVAGVIAQSAIGAKAQSGAGRSRGAERSRRTRCDFDAHRQSRSRTSGRRVRPHSSALRRRRGSARGPASAPLAAGGLESPHRRRDREGLERRDGAMAGARTSRTHRPRGARPHNLIDRRILRRRRAH